MQDWLSNNSSKQEHFFQRPLGLTRARLSTQCPPLSTPSITPFLFQALLLCASQGDQLHFEKDIENGMLRKIIFLLYYFSTRNLRAIYMADRLLCLGKAAAIPVFPYSPGSPFLSEPVCRLLWAAGTAWCAAPQNETPRSETSQVPSEKPTKQFRSRHIREGNQGKRK